MWAIDDCYEKIKNQSLSHCLPFSLLPSIPSNQVPSIYL